MQNNKEVNLPETGENTTIRMFFDVNEAIDQCYFAISFNSMEGENKILLSSELVNKSYRFIPGEHYVDCSFIKNPLQAGTYAINVFLKSNNDIVDWIQEALVVEVLAGDFYKTGRTVQNGNSSVLIDQNWD